MENVGIFNAHLVRLAAIYVVFLWPFWFILWSFGTFSPFWYVVPREIWQPW
jgi:hypothetical protein